MSSSKAVNRPVDLKQKETDVNNKLQLYGIFTGTYRAPLRLQLQLHMRARHWLCSAQTNIAH